MLSQIYNNYSVYLGLGNESELFVSLLPKLASDVCELRQVPYAKPEPGVDGVEPRAGAGARP